MKSELYHQIIANKKAGKKCLAVLIDPDKQDGEALLNTAQMAAKAGADFFFVGGSLLTDGNLDQCVRILKENTSIPVLLFPGNTLQISHKADGILFLSLISGRNAEMLIGRHVISAPYIKMSPLEVISAGYMLIESGKPTSVSYMSNTVPIPYDKNDIAACTAMAGEMLGLKLIYMDAGSGALQAVSEKMIQQVSSFTEIPLIVGGGIRDAEAARKAAQAGADIVVIGNAFENNPKLISEIAEAVHS